MKLLTKITHNFSYVLRSPINLDLLKTESGRLQLEQSIEARFKPASLLADLVRSYDNFRKDLHHFEKISQNSNQLKKQLKQNIKSADQKSIQALKTELATVKEELKAQQAKLQASKQLAEKYLLSVGNKVHQKVVKSKDEENNKVLRYYHPSWSHSREAESINNHKEFVSSIFGRSKSKSYQELTQEFGIADLGRGQKVSGHRGYFLCTNGVKLAVALAQYGLQFLQSKGYALYQTPALILQQVLKESCQLQSIQSDMYRLKQDNLCLIATSQQTLAGYYRGETFQPKKLPQRMAGYSSCFRREAGAHGKDIHGLFRLHQFEKVQQFVVCHPQKSQSQMENMLSISEAFYQSLGIPYRVLDIVSGELNDAAIRKIDIEAWFPGQMRFRELVSVSNCTDYQSRLLQTKYREGQQVKYSHMLNGTLVAIQRTITCLIQHFYSEKDKVLKIPAALQPFIRTDTLKPRND